MPATPTTLSGPDDIAYVIYTSGSTGRPKGVAVPHRGMCNRLLWMQEQYRLTGQDAVLQKTPFTFDVSVWEFFWPLLNGARLVLAEPGEHRDPRRLAATIERHDVTTVHFVPPMLDAFLAETAGTPLTSLRRVFCSGEALTPATVAAFFDRFGTDGPELHNLYGPTEASIDVTHWRCRPEDARTGVPIGHPVANTSIHLLDPRGEPVPAGLPGELYVGGVQVAAGYLNQPELTAQRFVPNPFGTGVLYRTGDVGRYRQDGAIEFLGRVDDQVKVRGFRVEPGEVEAALRRRDGVGQALVTVWEPRAGDRRLVAYLTGTDGKAPDPEALRRDLAGELPEYLVPAHVVVLDRFPVLGNGKVDRRSLPEPVGSGAVGSRPPTGERELLLHRTWQEVLGTDAVGVHDSFFALGGDSMLSIQVRAAVERQGWTFTIEDLMRGPTIAELAGRLTPLDGGRHGFTHVEPFGLLTDRDRAALPDDVEDAHPLSVMQAGMVYQAEYAADSGEYRVVTSVHLGHGFVRDALERAIDETFRRHPALRSSFDLVRFSEPVQLVHREVTVPLDVTDLTGLSPDRQDDEVRRWVQAARYHRFDLHEPPLVAFQVHRRGPESFHLSVVEHHVVLDGWSDGVMLAEIVARYLAALDGENLVLPELASVHRDFVAEERRLVAEGTARDFWAATLDGVTSTPLPTRAAPEPAGTDPGQDGADRVDHRDQPARRTEHTGFEVPVTEPVARRLAEIARAEGLPVKALLTAAHLAVLRLVSGSTEVLTGTVTNGRLEQQDGDQVIGVFLNTLPLPMRVRGSWLSVARRVFEYERDSLPHRRYPFALMQRDLGTTLAVDSYVNFVDFHLDRHLATRTGARILGSLGVAETNFTLAANFLMDPTEGRLRLALDCDTSVLGADLCSRLVGYYRRALEAIAADPGADVAAGTLLDPDEREAIAGWNDTASGYDGTATVHALIERCATLSADRVAVAHRDVELGYRDLDERANQLAHHLRSVGVRTGSLVGVSLPRGPELVVALLAVLKAGGGYVPMDPAFPRARLEFVARDCALGFLVTDQRGPQGMPAATTVLVDADVEAIGRQPTGPVGAEVGGDDTAYVIHTSGSTGAPKGTVVRHRNVVNFFHAMDRTVGCTAEDVLLAVTSVSFDISVLELLWPLTHGAKVVVAGEHVVENLAGDPAGDPAGGLAGGRGAARRALGFSLFFFAAATDDHEREAGYRLLLDAARFADQHGFEAVWTPERHFHSFGGLYPNPAVTAAALATITERVALRSGSVVAPLHDTVRMAEEWSLVDNLSHGRVGLAFASGWNSNDFVFFPDQFPRRRERMAEQLDEFRSLWRGEPVPRTGGTGEQVPVRIFPSPVQDTPPLWLTSAGSVRTFQQAGAAGVNVLTHLLGQDLDELATKITAYRAARASHGHDGPGRVTVMVHTFLGEDAEQARDRARGPFREYLRGSTELWRVLFASTGQELPETATEADLDAVLDLAVERYFERSGLFGSPDTALGVVRDLAAVGADEVACLIDFGVAADEVVASLPVLDRLRQRHDDEVRDAEFSFAELCRRHGVTMVQATPSFYSAVAAVPEALAALRPARVVLVGGEAFPAGLAQRLLSALPGVRVCNMYGPTETTIWSTVYELDPVRDRNAETIPVGGPVANTELLVCDEDGRPVPVGVPGELWIGGDGVARGYLNRPELTAQRFVAHPDTASTVYRTGDRVRWRPDGLVEFLGRFDRQVKILGHRVEPDEVESVLSRHPQVAAVAVTAVPRATGGTELVAYVTPTAAAEPDLEDAHVRRWEEVWDETYTGAPDGGEERFAGWRDSYTGEPIAEADMREWLAHTVARIRDLRPRSVVDVGVGAGLLLREIGPHVSHYLGLDVSAAAIATAEKIRPTNPGTVELRQGDATALASLPDGTATTVVMNSVVQYFPGASYLERVLAEAVRVAGPDGTVFVGDVRSVEALRAFHASVALHRAPPLHPVGELAAAIERNVAEERELCLSPRLFTEVFARLDPHATVWIELRRGRAVNELTTFRYDVTLVRGGPNVELDRWPRVSWTDLAGSAGSAGSAGWAGLTEAVERVARPGGPDRLVVTGIPNRRMHQPAALVRLLARTSTPDDDPELTTWDLHRRLWELDEDTAVDPEDVAELADQRGLRVRLLVPRDGDLTRFDAVFEHGPEE